jgi:hypothetical protein
MRSLSRCLLLTVSLMTSSWSNPLSPISPPQRPEAVAGQPMAPALASTAGRLLERVLVDEPGDGSVVALAEGYKAIFGARGLEFVPFFGSTAPDSFPVHFVLESLVIAGRPIDLPAVEALGRTGNRVTITRGVLEEIYVLGLTELEQRFLLRSDTKGDVEITLRVETGLRRAASPNSIAWYNEYGKVSYGRAFVIDGGERHPIDTVLDDGRIRLRVPTELRHDALLEIDPIIRSHPNFDVSQGAIYSNPDIAALEPDGRYLIAFERAFSSRDSDIVSELHTANGYVPGSLAAIETTTAFHSVPRVASLRVANRFLVVSERATIEVWGRAVDGSTGAVATNLIRLSDVLHAGRDYAPDVGGDPGTGPGPHRWCVAWIHENSTTDSDVFVRVFDQHLSTIALQPTVVADLPNSMFLDVSVSSSNANGIWTTPQWGVAYELRTSMTNHDLHAATVDLNGQTVISSTGIDSFAANTRKPCISSPATGLPIPGGPHFLVTFRDLTTLEARGRLLGATLRAAMSPPNFSRAFGLGVDELQNETDGCRFAIASRAGSITSVTTFGATTSGMVLMESPQALPGAPAQTRLCSSSSGGGRRADYGIVYQDRVTPVRVRWALHEGRQPGVGFARRLLACGGLIIQESGQPFLGARMEFELPNVNGLGGGFLLGLPAPASAVVCPGCPLGVDLQGPLLGVSRTASFDVPIPCDYRLLGASLTTQGFDLSVGPCLNVLRFSDAIDFTIR